MITKNPNLRYLSLITSLLLLQSFAIASIPMRKLNCMKNPLVKSATICEIQLLNAPFNAKVDKRLHESNNEKLKTTHTKKPTDVKNSWSGYCWNCRPCSWSHCRFFYWRNHRGTPSSYNGCRTSWLGSGIIR